MLLTQAASLSAQTHGLHTKVNQMMEIYVCVRAHVRACVYVYMCECVCVYVCVIFYLLVPSQASLQTSIPVDGITANANQL